MLIINAQNVVHLHARTHALSFSPLLAGHVKMLQTVPDLNEVLLQLIDCSYDFIHSLLHNTSDLIIHLIQVWAV